MKKCLEISNSISSILFWSIMSFILVASIVLLYFTNKDLYMFLSQEDSFFENATAILYFVAGSLLIISSLSKVKRSKIFWKEILTLLLGLFFMFIAGEEISWGQRIFNLGTPEILKEYNVQNEITIHNIKFLSNSFSVHRLLNIFGLLNGIVFPLLYNFNKSFRKLLNILNFPIVPLSCSVLFGIAILYEIIISELYHHWVHAEVKEYLFSVGFFIFSISLYRGKNRLEDRHPA